MVATHLPIRTMGVYYARTEPWRPYALAVDAAGDRPRDMYISVDSPTRSLCIAGDHLVVGGEGHRVGDAHDTGGQYVALERWAREHFGVQRRLPLVRTGLVRRRRRPYIGRMAGHADGVYVATAFKKRA